MRIELINVEPDEVGEATAYAFHFRKKVGNRVLAMKAGGSLLIMTKPDQKVRAMKLLRGRYVYAAMPNPYDQVTMYVAARTRSAPRAVVTSSVTTSFPPPAGNYGQGYSYSTRTWDILGWNGAVLASHSGTRRADTISVGGGGESFYQVLSNWSDNGFVASSGEGTGSTAGGGSGSYTTTCHAPATPSYAITGGEEWCLVSSHGVAASFYSGVVYACGGYSQSRWGYAWYGDNKLWYRQAVAPFYSPQSTDALAFESVAVPEDGTLTIGNNFPAFDGGKVSAAAGELTTSYGEVSIVQTSTKETVSDPSVPLVKDGVEMRVEVVTNTLSNFLAPGGYVANGVERYTKAPDGLMWLTYSSVVYESPFHNPALATAVNAGSPELAKQTFAAVSAGQDALMLRKELWLDKNSRDTIAMLENLQMPRGWAKYLREQAPHSKQLTFANELMLPTWTAELVSDEFVYGDMNTPNTSWQRVVKHQHTISFLVERRASALPAAIDGVLYEDTVIEDGEDPLTRREFSQIIDSTQTVTMTYSECDEAPGTFVYSTRVDAENLITSTPNQYGETISIGEFSERKTLLDLSTNGIINIQNGYSESGPSGNFVSYLRGFSPTPPPRSEAVVHTTPAIVTQYLRLKNWKYESPAPTHKRWVSSRKFSSVDVILFESAPTDATLGMFGIVSRRDRVRVLGRATIRYDAVMDTLVVASYTRVNKVVELDMETEVWPCAPVSRSVAESGAYPTFMNALLRYSIDTPGYEDELARDTFQDFAASGFRTAILAAVAEV